MSAPAPETERERRLRELAGRLLAHPGLEGLTTAELFLADSWDVPTPGNWRDLLLVLANVPGWRSLSVRVETFPGTSTGGTWSSIVSTRG